MIYLDNNATTPVDPLVKEAMMPFLGDNFANPSSPYMAGRAASRVMTESREKCAELINAPVPSILFTSGGTESNNTALHAALEWLPDRKQILISSVEHSSVLRYSEYLAGKGIEVILIPVNRSGALDTSFLDDRLSERTALVSVMTANNETGVIYPVESLARKARSVGALFHTDAVQAFGKRPIDVQAFDPDFLSFSAHKMYGPKGVGGLYVREGIKMPPYLHGGDQEHGRRGGTENVPGIAGLGKASELAAGLCRELEQKIKPLRDRTENALLEEVTDIFVAGGELHRLSTTSMIVLQDVDSESLVNLLDMEGICCSTGSACMSGSSEPSHVLQAMGYTDDLASSGIRLSFGKFNSQKDVLYVISKISSLIGRLRSI